MSCTALHSCMEWPEWGFGGHEVHPLSTCYGQPLAAAADRARPQFGRPLSTRQPKPPVVARERPEWIPGDAPGRPIPRRRRVVAGSGRSGSGATGLWPPPRGAAGPPGRGKGLIFSTAVGLISGTNSASSAHSTRMRGPMKRSTASSENALASSTRLVALPDAPAQAARAFPRIHVPAEGARDSRSVRSAPPGGPLRLGFGQPELVLLVAARMVEHLRAAKSPADPFRMGWILS